MYIVLNYKYVFVSDGYMSKSDQLLVGLVQERSYTKKCMC